MDGLLSYELYGDSFGLPPVSMTLNGLAGHSVLCITTLVQASLILLFLELLW
jgi:hypothetical protein